VVIGHVMKVKAVKNKVAAPFKETLVDLIYGKGIDKFADTIRFAITVGAIEKAGAWYSFAGERLGQGEKNVIDTIRGNDVLFKKIQAEIGKAIKAQQEADAE
jgi:recombination protein RecA